MLEPPADQRAGSRAEEGPAAGEGLVARVDVRADPGAGDGEEGAVPDLVREARVPGRGAAAGRGLGAAGGVLRLPGGTLEAPAHDEPGGVAVQRGAPPDERGAALKARGPRHRRDMEDPYAGGAEVPEGQRAGTDAARRPGHTVPKREAHPLLV